MAFRYYADLSTYIPQYDETQDKEIARCCCGLAIRSKKRIEVEITNGLANSPIIINSSRTAYTACFVMLQGDESHVTIRSRHV